MKLVSKFLILSLLLTHSVAFANFGGFSITETPLSSMEQAIDNLFRETRLDQRYLNHPKNLYGIKKALLRGCSRDYALLSALRTSSGKVGRTAVPNPNAEVDDLRQNLIISTAKIYGYIE